MSFKGLYLKLKDTHPDYIEPLKKALENEDYDYDGLKDIVMDNDDFDEFLKKNDELNNINGLKDAISKYVNDNTNSPPDSDDGPRIIEKLIEYYGNNESIGIVDDNELKEFSETITCESIYDAEDSVYNLCIRISINNDKQYQSILVSLVDNYTRYYIRLHLTKPKMTNIAHRNPVAKWWDNKVANLYNEDNTLSQMRIKFIAGINSFSKRLCPRILLPSTQRINDNINLYAKMVIQMFARILDIIKGNSGLKLPLQIDFVIYPSEITTVVTNDDYDSKDDGSDSENTDNNPANNMSSKPDINTESKYDYDTSNNNNGINIEDIIPDEIEQIETNYFDFNNASPHYYKIGRKIIPLLQKLQYSGDKTKRIVVIIDNKKTKNRKTHNEFTFKPIKYNTIHPKHIPELLIFNSKYVCKPKNAKTFIGANDASVLSLSFHLFNKNIIKCYQYWGSGFARFLMDDIVDLWPHLFVQKNGQNQSITKDVKQEILKLNNNIIKNSIKLDHDINERLN